MRLCLFVLCFLCLYGLVPSILARISPRLDEPLCSVSMYLPEANVNIQVDAWGSDSIRLRISPDDIQQVPDVQALLDLPPKEDGEQLDTRCIINKSILDGTTSLVHGNIRLDTKADGSFSSTRISDSTTLITSSPPIFNQVSFASIFPQLYSLYNVTWSYTHLHGYLAALGEHKTGHGYYSNFSHLFENSQIYGDSQGGDLMLPFYISQAGFGLLYNQAGYGYIDINTDQGTWFSNATHQFDIWITTYPSNYKTMGPTGFPYISSHYADATGHPNPLPHFASGFWQSKDRYRNESEVLDISGGFYNLSIPVQVFVIDWQHWQYLGDWTFVPQCWPNISYMVDTVQNKFHMHLMVSAWPRVDPRSTHYNDMHKLGYLTKDSQGNDLPSADPSSIIYDPFNPDARDYLWKALVAGYVRYGIEIFWLDAAEPEQSRPGLQWWNGKSDREIGMAWPVYHSRTIFDGLISSGVPESEAIMLSRSGWIGTPLYNALIWSGDTASTWDSFQTQVRLATNVGMSGLHWHCTDIAGYFGGQWQSADFNELLVRWYQWGAFQPVFRTHGHREPSEENEECGGGGGPNEVWRYQHSSEILAVIYLRERLRPYVEYHLNVASTRGIPIVQPMWYNFTDPECSTLEDQFMFGPTYLVAPIMQPLSQANTTTLFLPRLPNGEIWVPRNKHNNIIRYYPHTLLPIVQILLDTVYYNN